MKRVIIIPTYNERENIAKMIDAVMALEQGFDLLIVDDGSPDGTAALVKEAQLQYDERLHLLERSGKLGLGTAYIAGFKFALERGYDRIFEMDCDFSHNPDDLRRLDDMLDGVGIGDTDKAFAGIAECVVVLSACSNHILYCKCHNFHCGCFKGFHVFLSLLLRFHLFAPVIGATGSDDVLTIKCDCINCRCFENFHIIPPRYQRFCNMARTSAKEVLQPP